MLEATIIVGGIVMLIVGCFGLLLALVAGPGPLPGADQKTELAGFVMAVVGLSCAILLFSLV